MTLINQNPDGTTTTGREFEDFSLNLEETRANAEDMRGKAKTMEDVVKGTRWALEQVSEVEDQATEFLATIKSMDFSLKIASKVGPLKLPSKFVEGVLDRLEDVATAVRNKARSLERKIEQGDYINKLQNAEDKLSDVQDGIQVVEDKLTQYGGAAQTMLFAFDLVGTPLDPLENAANTAATPVNDVLVPINQTYNEIEALFDGLEGSFEAAQQGAGLFDALTDVARDFGAINSSLSFLKPPLEAIQSALAPVEWLLDAVGFVYDITVGPVIDFLLDKLGVTDIIERLGDRIAALLPDPDVLDEMERRIDETFGQIEDFIDGWDTRIDDYVEDITNDVVDALAALAPDALRFGDADRNTLEGRTDDLDLLNGLEGNDTLYGYAQADGPGSASSGDMFVASSGDDFNYGGAGTDWLILRGFVADYKISQFSDTAPVVFFDQQGRWGREVAEGIEQFVFLDGVFTLQQLRDMGALSPAATQGADLILGGDDDDVIAPLEGSDTIDGGAGIDTYLVPITGREERNVDVNLNQAITDAAGKEYTGNAWDGRTRDYIDNIENITIEIDRDAELVGTEFVAPSGGDPGRSGANVLISGGGEDFIQGLSGDDMLFGGADDDVIIGGAGQDRVYGGDDNDMILAGPAPAGRGEYYDGGAGTFDRLIYSTNRSDYDLDYRGQQLRSDALEGSGPLRIDGTAGTVQHMDGDTVLATDTFVGFEYIIGSDANDTVTGAPNAVEGVRARYDGGGGDDLIYTGGADSIFGGQGDDNIVLTEGGSGIEGGNGNDTLDLREFSDARILLRNSFNQRVDYTGFGDFEVERLGDQNGFPADNSLIRLFSGRFESIETLLLSDQNDEFYASGTARIEIFGAGGDDRFIRNNSNDGGARGVFHGGEGNDYFEFNAKGNEAYGDEGDDRMFINSSEDEMIIEGGTGDDRITLDRMDGVVHGGDGYDVLALSDDFGERSVIDLLLGTGRTIFVNGLGNDQDQITITALSGFEEVIGGDDLRDALSGSNDADRLIGRGQNDTLNGRGGNDELFGGDGNDQIDGGGGNDLMHGGAGNDRLTGGLLPDEIDTASYANTRFDGPEGALTAGDFGSVQVDLTTGRATGAQGNDTLEGIDNVIGSNSDDLLRGDTQNNALSGGQGNDTLEGLAGNDVLVMGAGDDSASGGAGNDTIIAGQGNSTSDGGDGTDLFSFGLLEGDVTLDLNTQSYSANLIRTLPVWRDDGTADPRVWNATLLTPSDIIETEAAFANSADDLTRDVPGPDDPLADQFEVVFAEFETLYTGTFANIEQVSAGAGNDTVHGTSGADWMAGGQGDDLLLSGAVRRISIDSVEAQVFRLYQATLDRSPDTGGFDTWVDRIIGNANTLPGVTGNFVASAEFQNTYGALDNGAFVDLLYQNVLGREGDEAGRAGWVDRLDSGSDRAEVVLGFSESGEFKDATILNASAFMTTAAPADWADDVFRLYQATLDRIPDFPGLQGWTGNLGGGAALADVAGNFVGSAEFQNTYGALDNEAFVTLLYENVLDRGPDATGLAGWLSRLDSGTSRAEVVLGFSQSAEFIGNTDAPFLQYMRQTPGDTIRGDAGSDMLAGGVASDHFVFSADAPGRDAVLSLDAWDDLSFLDFGYANADQARDNMRQSGQDVIFADQGVVVSFNGATLAELDTVNILV